MEPRVHEVVRIFQKVKGEKFLHIGCGKGDITALIATTIQAKEVYGIDTSSEAIAAAKDKGINAVLLVDYDKLPFADSFFDAVYCGEFIKHLFDPSHLLDEIHRVLRPKDICVISAPNLAGWAHRLPMLLGYQTPYAPDVSPWDGGVIKLLIKGPERQWGHLRIFTLRGFKELVQLHGFRIKRLKGVPITVTSVNPSFRYRLTKVMDRLMAKIPSLANQVIVKLEV